MAGTTTNRAYPYPTSGDAANIASNIQSLATSIDTDVNTNFALKASPTFTGTPLSTTAAVDTNTTQIATTAFVVAQASATAPIINGTATVGTSLRYSRQDHIHPTDTSRAALASPTFTGQVTVPAGTTLSATRNLTDVNTVQSVFGVGLTVAAATTYEIDMFFGVSTTGATSNSLGIGFGGTATLTSIGYEAIVGQNATSLGNGATPIQYYIQVATNSTITAAVATATYRTVRVRGLVRVNASGTFIPQLTFSAATGAVPVVAANSRIKMTPIGTNTVTTIGAWA